MAAKLMPTLMPTMFLGMLGPGRTSISAKCGRIWCPKERNSPQFAKNAPDQPEQCAPKRWLNGARC
jgi:hypothetical protein